jgi:hypothetical protein
VIAGTFIVVIVGFFSIPVANGQMNECIVFDGKKLVVVRANNDCLGYADAKMADEGWTLIVINNESIYMEKNGNNSQPVK